MFAADADVMIVAEVDDRWARVLKRLASSYPHQVVYPQDNWYGLALLSRLPIEEHQVRSLVQDDAPSIDASLQMNNGQWVRVVAVHPRPPEPIRGNDASARDAELVLWGRALAEEKGPVLIGGDLNDVAWSQSTRLFLRISQLLDPRRGRGLFNSFHADRGWMRFPLDHLFHSDHFTIRDLRRLRYVGSDHFPIFIELQHQPVHRADHEPLEQKTSDEVEAEERIERAEETEQLDPRTIDKSNHQPVSGRP